MTYYNNSTSPKQGHFSPPPTSRETKPVFTTATPTYISSPFDDEPVLAHNNNNNNLEKSSPYNNPYNPDYMPSSYRANPTSPTSNNYNQSSFHSTQEHSLSPSFTEKALPSTAAVAGAGGQTYAMQHLPNNNTSPYDNHQYNNHNNNHDSYYNNGHDSNYYNGYDEDRPSLSNDTAPMRPYADMETSEGLTRQKSGVTRVKYGKEKSKYLPCFPCIRSTCGRVTCCLCLLILLVIIALAIVVFTVFKLPKVNYLGMESDPQFQFNQGDTTLGVKFVANIAVENPNPIGFKFESIVATAYYPGYAPSIGGGNLTQVDFPSKSKKTIAFPISASYSGAQDNGFTVVKDILVKCGKTGADPVDLTINYDLKLTIRVLGINISPTIKDQHASFACPENIMDVANGIPGGVSSIIGGAAP
ncbi:hypothetical protein BGX27_010703 [Mortierella sp. AM989]|nr:hypothetical protein BGX27_010703 [Mortierella sp. AM989]